MKSTIIILASLFLFLTTFAQEELGIKIIGKTYQYKIGVYNSDTVRILEPAYCFPVAKNQKELERYWKLVYNVKRVYPYAKIARQRIGQINNDLSKINGDKERKEYIKVAEKQLFVDFESDIRDMTFTQGRILIKLIDRETGNTSYALVKEYKGTFTAFFWQGVARIFGSNLKAEYDPVRDDRQIENIICRIDQGQI